MRLSLIALALLLAAPLQAAEIKLASWNIAWLTLRHAGDPALPRDLATRRPADFERLAAYARRLDADVVALQEVDGTDAAARVFDPAQYAFHFTEEHDVQRPGFAIRRGIPFTRNPDLEELDLIPRARFSLRRGADVTLHLGEQRLRLLSVHLKAGCREGPLDGSRDCESLGQQSAVLARWIAERREERAAFIVLGDFNRRMQGSRDAFLEELRAAAPLTRANEGVSDPCWSDARGGRPFITHMLLGGRAREWMVPGSLRVMVYAERDWSLRERISDHCPLSIRLRAG
ncbi:endonuclease/exonuclease/phosphatase family protein [Roseococcus sp. YIM B11640]|uniref:endonuclease/exonuclease/phosphatase family protein n=1 Tax=Roseococcus sp. YIM B11640 TaxID=3133973 RepID=UPI003C7E4E47